MTSYQNLSDALTKTSLEILGMGHLTDYSKNKKTPKATHHWNEEPNKTKRKF